MKPARLGRMAPLATMFLLYSSPLTAAPPMPPLRQIDRKELCVTNGIVSTLPDGRLTIDTPSSRAIVQGVTMQAAEIRFRYVGPTPDTKPLASGELRRQIGLKLRAQDTCNVLYAMWHIEPDAKIAVALKRNPGQQTHAQCSAQGYQSLTPRTSVPLPRIRPGESHTFRAQLDGDDLTVLADGQVVWAGSVGSGITDVDGPVGLRTDNARFELTYYATRCPTDVLPNAAAAPVNRCAESPDDER